MTDTTDENGDDPDRDGAHRYRWRCTGCKAEYDERPDQCERCGETEFREFRAL